MTAFMMCRRCEQHWVSTSTLLTRGHRMRHNLSNVQKCKNMAFDILKANLDLQATVSVFNDPDANAVTVAVAGEAFLHTLYGGRKK